MLDPQSNDKEKMTIHGVISDDDDDDSVLILFSCIYSLNY